MANYPYCPTCGLTSAKANHDSVIVYECNECGNFGCYGEKYLFGTVGCWAKVNCPNCGKSDYKQIGYLA